MQPECNSIINGTKLLKVHPIRLLYMYRYVVLNLAAASCSSPRVRGRAGWLPLSANAPEGRRDVCRQRWQSGIRSPQWCRVLQRVWAVRKLRQERSWR